MPNRLAQSTSLYLLQHAHQPVDWYPWGEEAFEKARRENKPIFLSIGYAACHWCHVMAHESFDDPEIAKFLNQHFVPVKVDREEHPDVDHIYMQAVIAMTGHGGWPLSVFLTPEGEPFYGGTYFPPEPRHGLPSFRQVLEAVAQAWYQDPEGIRRSAAQLSQHLQQRLRVPLDQRRGPLHPQLLEEAVGALHRGYDQRHGGWGTAPKFPSATVLEFLLRQATRGNQEALSMAVHTLHAMAQGGMYDLLGGGFHRYSVDAFWWVPHFEKMLYDNALLARIYLYGYLITGQQALAQVVEETLTFLLRDMRHPQGAFYSSLDADTQGEEGATYTWTPEEVRAVLSEEEWQVVHLAYGFQGPPQMEGGRYVLRRVYDLATLAQRLNRSPEEIQTLLERARTRLFQARKQRPQPEADDKILLGWNALALWALAEAGFYLNQPGWVQAAREVATFLLEHLRTEAQWFHAWAKGRTSNVPAYLDDHAALALALLALYRADPQPLWYQAAMEQVRILEERFRDPEGGWADTPEGYQPPVTRPKTLEDHATPSGNALAVTLWLHTFAYTGESRYRQEAEALLEAMVPVLTRYPQAFGQWLCALDLALGPLHEVALLASTLEDPQLHALVDVLRSTWYPRALWAISPHPPGPQAPPLVQERPLLQNQATAYVCQNMVCHTPTTDPAVLRQQLGGES